jgi:hypothetical protein
MRNRICSPADRSSFSLAMASCRDSALHGIDRAREIGKNAVACCVEDPTAMRDDQAIDDDPILVEDAKGSDLTAPHQAAVV